MVQQLRMRAAVVLVSSVLISGGLVSEGQAQSCTTVKGCTNAATSDLATVGGGGRNEASGKGATIGGGWAKSASGETATVGGGVDNMANHDYATVAGGLHNQASGESAAVEGGWTNSASGETATVGGGSLNTAKGESATVGGGYRNEASGHYATVPGGSDNRADGIFSFAVGTLAEAIHLGSFVWADATGTDPAAFDYIGIPFASTAENQFNIRAAGGTRIFSNGAATVGVQLLPEENAWSIASDRELKEDFQPVDKQAVLEQVRQLPVTEWKLKAQTGQVRHIGPVAQDFHAAFRMGASDRHIHTGDADGIALVAIQALAEQNATLAEQNATLQTQVAALLNRVAVLEQKYQE